MSNEVWVFCGGRGSGKTLSMTGEAIIKMKRGLQCWANYPIRYGRRFANGLIKRFRSQPVEIEDLITFKPEIKDGIICLDELNLWANNRGSMSLLNRLLNAWMQLIRKRNLSIYITVQAFDSLDKMVRWQCDVTVECFDLKHLYKYLREGAWIRQTLTDWSGLYTGHPITRWYDAEQRRRNTDWRTMRGYLFWGSYDSWQEYDILQAMTKYEVERDVKVIGKDDEQAFIKSTTSPKDMAAFFDAIKGAYPPSTILSKGEVHHLLRGHGFNISTSTKKMLRQNGFEETIEGYVLPA